MTLKELLNEYVGDVEFSSPTGDFVALTIGQSDLIKFVENIEVISWQAIKSTQSPKILVTADFSEVPEVPNNTNEGGEGTESGEGTTTPEP